MNLEEVDETTIGRLTDAELRDLRGRAVQLWERTEAGRESVRKRTIGVNTPIDRDKFTRAYLAITAEMSKRALPVHVTPLDQALTKRLVRGVDVSELPPIMLRPAAVCLVGAFVQDPKRSPVVEVWLDDDDYPRDLEKRLVEALLDQTGKDAAVVSEAADGPVVPCYDLVLMPRAATKEEPQPILKRAASMPTDISKPFPSEHAARQMSPGQFADFRRENDKFGKGVHAIWGILPSGKVKLQSVRFSITTFTPEQAKAWLKEHDMKGRLEEASGVKKRLFVKSAEDRVVGGIVYAPDEVDGQGDYTDSDEIWKAMKHYMSSSGGVMKIMHDGHAINTSIVECFQAEEDTVKGGENVPAGAWYLSAYVPPEHESLWKAIKDGRITGFSMAGSADVEEVER